MSNDELTTAGPWLQKAEEMAQRATCTRAHCGAVIVADNTIIGTGYNSPPGECEAERRCSNDKTLYDRKVTDKTCCIHAEQRAVMDALRTHPDKLAGATLYYVGLLPDGALRCGDDDPRLYCTLCAKMMHEVGIATFVLKTKEGAVSVRQDEYVGSSYEYHPHKHGEISGVA